MAHKQDQKNLLLMQVILVCAIVGTLAYVLLRKSHTEDASAEDGKAATELVSGKSTTAKGNRANADGNFSNADDRMTDADGNFSNADGRMTDADGNSQYANIPFDPNTADSATLVAVGFSSFQARNILKYRAKGGRYHSKEEVKKVYSLTVNQWHHIEPLIRISKGEQYIADTDEAYTSPQHRHPSGNPSGSAGTSYGDPSPNPSGGTSPNPSNGTSSPSMASQQTSVSKQEGAGQNTNNGSRQRTYNGSRFADYPTKLRQGETINLAKADTNELKRIPGVGSYYARRIAEYGQKLGGYVSINQINDAALDFLPEGIERWMTISQSTPRQLHINKCTTRQLNNHPYINYPQAKQLSSYIRLYGAIKSWDELLRLSEFSEADKARLQPYIAFD